ncbi:Transposase family Tnp2 protein [Ceratobasidium sp. AG-Ba]|nr:Transposase family Tnp2 protein [Ceratobasidium sp. AG-Ba]QRW11760.1 Transposase family Tnp2 protein [Ceratobasidium sp. AG-Ba]
MPICEHCGKEYSERQIRRHRAKIRDLENRVFLAALNAMDVDVEPQAHNNQPFHGDDFAIRDHDGAPRHGPPPQDHNPPPQGRDPPLQDHDGPIAHVNHTIRPGAEPAAYAPPVLDNNPAVDEENLVAHDEGMPAPQADFGNMEVALACAGPRWQLVDLDAVVAGEGEAAAPPVVDGLENNHPALLPPPPPMPHPLVGVRHNPPVAVEEWFAEDWPDEDRDEDFDEDLSGDEFDEDPHGFDGELFQDIERITEPALSIGYGASVASMECEPEFHELDEPVGVNPDNEPEMNDGEFWEYLQDEFGDLAEEEWVDMYTRILTDQDRASLRFLAARQRSHFSRAIYDDLRLNACEAVGLPSDFVAWRRLKILSGLESRTYDCCLNSCICYVGIYSELEQCRYCKAPRFNAAGEPRRMFNYTPLIPQLLGLFQNPESIKKMRHRAGHEAYRAAHPGVMEDVFDGELYRRLRNTKVTQNSEY